MLATVFTGDWTGGALLAPLVHRVTSGTNDGEKVIPWFLGAHVLPTLRGADDGGRHPITI